MIGTRVGAIAACLLLFFTTNAHAEEWYSWSGATSTTARAGNAGSQSTVKQVPQNSFLYAIHGYEKSDKPCRFNLDGWTGPLPARVSESFGLCQTTSAWKKAELDKTQRNAVTGLKVCLNKAGNRVKGVKLYSGSPNSQGVFSNSSATATYSRTNCKTWSNKVSCPTGKAAVGVKFFHDGSAVSGMSLVCASANMTASAPANAGQTAGRLRTTGALHYTSGSGHPSNTHHHDVVLQGHGYVTSVGLAEKGNNPCKVEIDGWSYSGPLLRNEKTCSNDPSGMREAEIASYQAARDNERGITAIRACLNSATKATPLSPSVPGDEIKGIRVYGATANSAGRFVSDGTDDKFNRPNCAHWSNKVSCPAGQVAVGVRVGYHGDLASKHYRNIALICKQSERTP